MALNKAYDWKGWTPQHWRILDRRVVEQAENVYKTICQFGLWKNLSTYQAQTDPFKREFVVPAGPFEMAFDGDLSKSQCYELAKTTELLSNGQPNPMFGATDE